MRTVLVVAGLLTGVLVAEVATSFLMAWMDRCAFEPEVLGPPAPPPKGNRVIVVLGDSFAYGYGLCDKSRRFGDQLRVPGATVYTLAAPGLDTQHETRRLRAFPYTPDLLVLSYCGNDIEAAAHDAGVPDYAAPWIVTTSALAKLVYLTWSGYLARYKSIWSTSSVVERHMRELDALLLPQRSILVVFPHLSAIEESRPVVELVIAQGQHSGASVLDVRELVGDLSIWERIVHPWDPHPSELVHTRVARRLEQETARVRVD